MVIIRGSSTVFLSQIQSTVKRVSHWILSPASFFPCKLSVWPPCGTALTGWMYHDLGLHPGAHLIAASVIPSSASIRHYLFWKLCLETCFSLRSVQLSSRQYLLTDYLPFYMLRIAHMHSTLSHKSFPHSVAVNSFEWKTYQLVSYSIGFLFLFLCMETRTVVFWLAKVFWQLAA